MRPAVGACSEPSESERRSALAVPPKAAVVSQIDERLLQESCRTVSRAPGFGARAALRTRHRWSADSRAFLGPGSHSASGQDGGAESCGPIQKTRLRALYRGCRGTPMLKADPADDAFKRLGEFSRLRTSPVAAPEAPLRGIAPAPLPGLFPPFR